MKISIFLSYLLLVSIARGIAASHLIVDLLQEYPTEPNCDFQYVTDQTKKLNFVYSVTKDAGTNRAVTLWNLSAEPDSISNVSVSMGGSTNCVMVFVDANPLVTVDFIKKMSSKGFMGQSHFYAIKMNNVNILTENNITEIYNFPHMVFLVEKVMSRI